MAKTEKYFEGIGRRKTAIARVRFYSASAKKAQEHVIINGSDYKKYFPLLRYQKSVLAPLRLLKTKSGEITVHLKGGGPTAQAEAVTLGLARALVKFDSSLRSEMRAFGFLTRDPRMVERKKYGLKKARRAPQWTKR